MEIIYLSLHCDHQNDSCVKMGSDETHFSEGQSNKTVSADHTQPLKRKESRSGINQARLKLSGCLFVPPQIAPVKELFRLTRDDELKAAENKYLPKV